ncbi:MAG TPA: EamA family transporter [Flavobacteriales bacterium]|nr:EamA family transporter [Flavobacteriales bacterium]HMU14874.1 EamA family transporter [Flavobacteriales bacterium]HNI04980.1 EamA family transporter [Flavobacteriales bacterium]HNK68413.1 EamA family transporter [Flavobacteriales bacterium]
MSQGEPSRLKVYLAFAAIYIIWGSTYYGIKEALTGFPPFMLGGLRFAVAGTLLFAWCAITRTPVFPVGGLWKALLTGFLLLFLGNGAVVWAQQTIPSSVVAITIAVAPLTFTLFDRPNWGGNFRSPATLSGVLAGVIGVWLLFSERLSVQLAGSSGSPEGVALVALAFAILAWPAGSIFTKYNPVELDNTANSAWQMLMGALCFLLVSAGRGEWSGFSFSEVPPRAWLAEAYLVVFGSIIGYSAYVWLLSVRPATQVSTYAYVNPVVAVLLGVFLGNETLEWHELAGLVVILGGVLLINLAKYRPVRN